MLSNIISKVLGFCVSPLFAINVDVSSKGLCVTLLNLLYLFDIVIYILN